ncbi:SDR family oxidoreductase [Corynebacterium auris]|uniref:SDR family oxidoreductase n=1 Tax=Corynebacterium auris TaxID=44750 RepID=UPI0025B3705B|nr:SDR family oxidoreductase [Corynebacterium auris]WJY67838.1 putative sugar epimerase YhfK [Corynebacterium auris]
MAHNVAIIGAHGKVARLAVPRLREQGHTVVGLIRKQEQVSDVEADGATPVVFDIQDNDTAAIEKLLREREIDTVVWSAGAGGGNPERTYAVDRDAAKRAIDAAVAAGVGHFIMVSYFGAGLDHGVDKDNDFYPYAQAKGEADEHLERSGLNFTLVRPSMLTLEEGTGRIDASADEPTETSRANVAHVVAAAVDNGPAGDATLNRVIEFNDGETRIEDVLGN